MREDYYDADDWYDSDLTYCQMQYKDGKWCGQETTGDGCEQCGKPLCPQHMEGGANFCDSCPTDDYRPSYLPEIDTPGK